jgi:hypothetical protein
MGFPNFSRNILSGIGEEVTPKRSPKRRGPAKKYTPEPSLSARVPWYRPIQRSLKWRKELK